MADVAVKWEYLILSNASEGVLASQLNDAGEEGWELVNGCLDRAVAPAVWSAFLRRPARSRVEPKAAAKDTSDLHASEKTPTKKAGKPGKPAAKDETGFDVVDDDGSTFDLQL